MRALPLILVAAALACSDNPAAPSPFGASVPISVTPVDAPADTARHIYVGFDKGLMTIHGRIATPDPCYELSAYRALAGNELKVTVVATPHRQGCASSLDHFDYQVLTDTPTCPHLTLWYHYVGVNWPDVKVGEINFLC
ncbi:MAG: hypothetical protein HOQ09_13165 [Gemmatimonadaceae bacterium]|nr:hypothetical protein [Gemmatimonadaceae bacterium]